MIDDRLSLMARVGTVFLTWRRYLQKGYAKYRITLKQSYLLRQLRHREFLYPSDIAQMLYCDRPTATVIIRNMVRQGWVTKEADTQNRKRWRIQITDCGRRKYRSVHTSRTNPERLFDPEECFTKAELLRLERLLIKLQRHVGALSK